MTVNKGNGLGLSTTSSNAYGMHLTMCLKFIQYKCRIEYIHHTEYSTVYTNIHDIQHELTNLYTKKGIDFTFLLHKHHGRINH